ncbi:hypothetical protein QNI19_22405 [Cytophagaceae bacterium DM2B3-1]|uniref:PH domain-containing protein n=1 Tax=Xanthocytophaga flava TaxID=3048013 RepID=A0ABT7CPM9_9BACT|nr:hypothetical protein [Xanthocytophaga flavus]MDJ1495705.1 hypothetical protein [Xanthocytophaga flavus]
MKKNVLSLLINSILSIGCGIILFIVSDRIPVGERMVLTILWLVLTFLTVQRSISHHKQFFLEEDVLVIKLLFKKEKRYLLHNIQSWKELNYTSLGFAKDRRAIHINLHDGKRIELIDKYNQVEFEKLSDYLNENFPEVAKD